MVNFWVGIFSTIIVGNIYENMQHFWIFYIFKLNSNLPNYIPTILEYAHLCHYSNLDCIIVQIT